MNGSTRDAKETMPNLSKRHNEDDESNKILLAGYVQCIQGESRSRFFHGRVLNILTMAATITNEAAAISEKRKKKKPGCLLAFVAALPK